MLKQEIVNILGSVGIKTSTEILEVPQVEFGDIAFPCFELAKKERKNPKEIAEDVAKKIKISKDSLISRAEAKAGYVNFFYNYSKVSEIVLKRILKEKKKFGSSKKFKNKVVVVDYSSPNPAHPIHVGSARTTFIGESLCRILENSGYKAKRICYVNALGKQVATLIYGYIKFAKGKKPNKKPDHWLFDIYIKANEEIEKNPEEIKKVEEILRKCEAGDKKMLSLSSKLVNWCLDGFKGTYKILGIKFDEYLWESKFIEISKKYVHTLLEKKAVFKTEDGATIVNFEPYNLPNTVLLRSDGTGLYLTRDVAASIYKLKKYRPSLNIFVVGEDQKLHFQQEFKILELLGYEDFSKNSFHLGYGIVSLLGEKMSSRKGKVVLIDDIFDEAMKKVEEKYTKDKEISKAVGIGAVIYSILKVDPNQQITFEWEKALALRGDTGPYLQYAHTRCAGILRKAKKWKPNLKIENISEEEKILVKTLMIFPEVVEKAAKDLRPHYICNYVYELATIFDKFYETCSVLKAENEKLKAFRLSLVDATRIVLENSLNLIGIEAPEKM